jgi:hypothetical protein
MKKELIDKIRCMLDFIEKFDELLDKAKRDDDKEWEDELYADLSQAECGLRECVSKLLDGNEEGYPSAESDELPF